MMRAERIALIDDNPGDLALWRGVLDAIGFEAVAFGNRSDFAASVSRGDFFDAVVLDWYLETDSSVMARLVLEQDLRTNLYAPVLVYTNESDVAEAEIKSLTPPFDRIQIISKEVRGSDLGAALKEWYEKSIGARLSGAWRKARRKAFEQTLYDLESLEGRELHQTLSHLIVYGDERLFDLDHTIDFLERFVGRKTQVDDDFRKAIAEVFGTADGPERTSPSAAGSLRLRNAHRYIAAGKGDKIVRTGDIVAVLDESGNRLALGVVITPACDIDMRKCRELRLVLAEREAPGSNPGAQWWPLHALRTGAASYETVWLNFHKTLCLTDLSIAQDAKKPLQWAKSLSYDSTFSSFFGDVTRLEPICRLDDPYKADLLQKFASHAARVGTP